MAEAFQDADIVYPKSWAPFAAMEKRTNLYGRGDQAGIKALEKELLAQNAQHKDWCCTEEMMKTTKDGKALYLHCLPADINGLLRAEGEVEANSVFDRYRALYKEASFKPYIIAAMIFLAQGEGPQVSAPWPWTGKRKPVLIVLKHLQVLAGIAPFSPGFPKLIRDSTTIICEEGLLTMGKRIVIALGGNALGNNLPEQMVAVKQTARAIVDLIQEGIR